MAVSLDSFLNHANSIDGNRSIYLDHKGEVKDKGAFRTFFTSKETFRKTTNEFLNALQNEFGQEIGGIARGLLQRNVEAGKPLKASMVKDCIRMAQQSAMRQTITNITSNHVMLEGFVTDLTDGMVSSLTQEQASQIKQCFIQNQMKLEEMSSGKMGSSRQSLLDAMQQGEGAFLKRSIDLIAGNQNSPLVRLGYPKESDPQLVKDKLQVLSMLQTMDGPIVNNPVLIQAMTALDTLRAANPAPGEFTAADLFNAVYPENTTPTLERPSNEEVALYTPSQLLNLFDQANEDFTNNFTADKLPENSPLRGTEAHTKSALNEAKSRLFMPSTIATLSGDRVTLEDLPQMQFDVSVNSKYDTKEAALAQMAKDISRRGMMGMTETGLPPTISFQEAGGEAETVTIGSRLYDGIPEDQLTDDQKAYKAGNESSVSRDLTAKIDKLASSPAQAKAMAGCLNQSGSYPMWHAMKGFGDFAYLREHCAYNQSVTKNTDGSVDVSLNTSADLKSLVGTATMTYHIDTDGRVGITDFQWDKPTLQEQKDGMKNCTGYSQSIPSRISGAIKSLEMNKTVGKVFAELAHGILDAKVDAAATAGELPSFDSIRDAMPPSHDAAPVLKNFVAVATTQSGFRTYMMQPPEDRDAFAAAVAVCQAANKDTVMDMIQDCLPQLKELHENGNLTMETAWHTMFNEDIPDSSKALLGKAPGAAFDNRIFDKFKEDEPTRGAGEAGFASFFVGLKFDVARGMEMGNVKLDHITPESMRRTAGMLIHDMSSKDGMEHVDTAEVALAKDLPRMCKAFGDSSGKLKTVLEASSIAVNLPSGKEGAPENLHFDPLNPQNLTKDDEVNYRRGNPNGMTADIRERITNFCGKENRAQITNTLLAMSQVGRQMLRDMPSMINAIGSEHAQANISVFGDDQKNLHVRYQNLEHSVVKFNFEFKLAPDGGQQMLNFDMHRADVE